MEKKVKGGSSGGEVSRFLGFMLFLLKKIIARKKFFLLLAWILLAVIGTLIFFSGSSAILPAIYMAF